MVRSDIANRIEERLKAIGRSARGVSIAIGRDPTYIRDLLRGRKVFPRLFDLEKLALELQCEPGWLVFGPEGPPIPGSFPRRLRMDPKIRIRAEAITDRFINREKMLQRFITPEEQEELQLRARLLAALYDAIALSRVRLETKEDAEVLAEAIEMLTADK